MQKYCGNNSSFVKDIRGLAKSLKEQKVAPGKTLVSFNVSFLFTSIQIPGANEFIERKFMEQIDKKGTKHFLKKNLFHQVQSHLTFGISSSQLCLLLPRKILPTTTRGCSWFPSIPVIANIYMEYFIQLT